MKIKTICYEPILLIAEDSGEPQFIPEGQSVIKLFPNILKQSHPGSFVDGIFTAPEATTVSVNVAVRAGDSSPISIIPRVNGETVKGRADGVNGPVSIEVELQKNDTLTIVIASDFPGGATLSANPLISNLTIRQIE